MAFGLSKNKLVGLKIETSKGVKEVVGVGDYGLECSDLTASAQPEFIERSVFKGSISAEPGRIGKVPATVELGGEFKNSGTAGTAPKIDTVLKAARMARASVQKVAVTAATGSIKRGQTVLTGGTSGAKVLALSVEDGVLYFVPRGSIALQPGEVLSDSVYSATSGTLIEAAGYLYSPASTGASEQTVTVQTSEGGLLKEVYGAAGTFSLTLSTSDVPTWKSSFSGICEQETWGTQSSVSSDSVAWEDAAPPVVVNAHLRIGEAFAPVASSITLDLGAKVNLFDNLNSDSWLGYAILGERAGTGTISILSDLGEAAGLYAKMFAGATAALEFKIGSGAWTQIDVLCPRVQYTGISEGDENGVLSQTLNLKLTGADAELLLWFR